MNAKMAMFAAGLTLATQATGQGYAGLGASAEGYRLPDPETTLTFPQDHSAHPGFRIEWWYLTANLTDQDDRPLGLQWTLFRQEVTPGGPQVWMGHAAVTTPNDHFVAETFARGDVGQAGVTALPFEAYIDDWSMRTANADAEISELTLTASGSRFDYQLSLSAMGPLVLHGDKGHSVKSASGQASHYYSQPGYTLTGTVTLNGDPVEVQGQAWLDREWSSQPLAEDQQGWDWISLHLESGAKLMAYRLRGPQNYTIGTWIDAAGEARPLVEGALQLEPTKLTEVLGRQVPTSWRVVLAEQALDIEVSATNPQSYMTTLFPYWEGPVTATGSHPGRGYLEMTGY